MSVNQKTRIIINLALTILLPLLMAYSLIGESVHEWLGLGMVTLFILHHKMNLGWYKNLFHGRYPAFRIFLTTTNCLLTIDFLLLFYSGLDLSRHLLSFLPELGSASLSRILHLSASHWGLILMSFHSGLHLRHFTFLLKKKKSVHGILTLIVFLIALYGCCAFFKRKYISYLIPVSAFMFFDASQALSLFLGDSLSIMTLFTLLGHGVVNLTQYIFIKKEN